MGCLGRGPTPPSYLQYDLHPLFGRCRQVCMSGSDSSGGGIMLKQACSQAQWIKVNVRRKMIDCKHFSDDKPPPPTNEPPHALGVYLS